MDAIIDTILTMEIAVPTAVALIGAARLWFGDTIFHVRWIKLWNAVRRAKVPAINTYVLGNLVPFDFEIENTAHADEFVGVSRKSQKDIAMSIAEVCDPEVPLLAGLKTDWEGRKEVGTDVNYYGPKPFPSAPDWLRPRQVHRTYFQARGPDGRLYTVVTAHDEANSYRPDKWADHLFKKTFSAKEGVRRTILKLEEAQVSWDHNPSWMDVEPSLNPETADTERTV